MRASFLLGVVIYMGQLLRMSGGHRWICVRRMHCPTFCERGAAPAGGRRPDRPRAAQCPGGPFLRSPGLTCKHPVTGEYGPTRCHPDKAYAARRLWQAGFALHRSRSEKSCTCGDVEALGHLEARLLDAACAKRSWLLARCCQLPSPRSLRVNMVFPPSRMASISRVRPCR